MVKGKSLSTPVISSWKYAGAWASPNRTFTYSNFPKGELNAVFGVEGLSKGMQWSNVVKYVAPYSLEKISSTLGMGHVNFLVTLLRAL